MNVKELGRRLAIQGDGPCWLCPPCILRPQPRLPPQMGVGPSGKIASKRTSEDPTPQQPCIQSPEPPEEPALPQTWTPWCSELGGAAQSRTPLQPCETGYPACPIGQLTESGLILRSQHLHPISKTEHCAPLPNKEEFTRAARARAIPGTGCGHRNASQPTCPVQGAGCGVRDYLGAREKTLRTPKWTGA